jgi:predicted phage replisome organizer
MAEVKWIKIVTDVFDDEKILMIETLPDADSIIVIWFKLLCLAGKQNNGGVFLLGRMPYTDEMFATVFRRPINTVRLALKTFVDFGMIEIINNTVTIPNWVKHQSLDAYEKKKERDRLYQAERRAAQKQIAEKSSDTSSDIASQIRRDKKKTREEEIIHSERNAHACARGEGAHGCVFLTDYEIEELYNRLGVIVAKQYIKRLDQFIFDKGATVADHFNTILKWWEEDKG